MKMFVVAYINKKAVFLAIVPGPLGQQVKSTQDTNSYASDFKWFGDLLKPQT